MPKRSEIKKVLIIGSGPIVIGQACEFDYSGAQAIKAMREEGVEVVLLNSNPATIMTDPELAHHTYIEPINLESAEKILALERPDSVLPTMGGQTALNLSKELAESGVLQKYGAKLIGASLEAINRAEDRLLFKASMQRIGIPLPKSGYARNIDEAIALAPEIGFPAIIRPSFTLGGTGGGIAYNINEYEAICRWGLTASPVKTILIEESVLGWKEFELEVMRDCADNVVIVCSIENFDPMGVHTGDSITVAPIQTLTDKEYQRMRQAAIAIIREIGVDTGGSNIQFGIHPRDGRMVVIEMNPRVSRSSALASKATGYPIAKIAAKLALGYRLDELRNDITRDTPASFEPTLDYVVVKIPRFNYEKFPHADRTLNTQMHSVGEVMSIGRTFKEAYLKALRSMESSGSALEAPPLPSEPAERESALREALRVPRPERPWYIAQAFRERMTVEQVHELSAIDPWFLRQIRDLVQHAKAISEFGRIEKVPDDALRSAKADGFSDRYLGELLAQRESTIREHRQGRGIRPVYKRVDTCAAEFEAYTPYLYSTYEEEDEAPPSRREKVIILGSGPIRIGQGIEFDYCCVHAAFALREAGYETVMINCNPETVSTDYDTSDRLYFEPLTIEDVLEISQREKPLGAIVQFGGQTPLSLAVPLEKAGLRILGTSPDAIDRAEDRERFAQLIEKLGLRQPENGMARSPEEAFHVAQQIGYPVMVRPSYVLGGRAMEVVHDASDLERYMQEAVKASPEHPVLIDRFLKSAIEVDLDLIADRASGARGGGRHPLGGCGDELPAALASGEADRANEGAGRRGGARAWAGGPDERSVRDPGGQGLHPRGQSPGVSHRAVHLQGHRGAAGEAGGAVHGGQDTRRAGARRRAFGQARGGQRVGVSLRPIRRGGRHSRAGDEVHRRGDGDRGQLSRRLRQEPARRRGEAAQAGQHLDLGEGRRQAVRRRSGAPAARPGLHPVGDRGKPPVPRRPRDAERAPAKGHRGAPSHRRQDRRRGDRPGDQHHFRQARDRGQLFHPARDADAWHSLFHDHSSRRDGGGQPGGAGARGSAGPFASVLSGANVITRPL